MGDHQRGDGLRYFLQVSHDVEFGGRIKRRSGFIEDKDSWLLDCRPCDRQSLPFSPRQLEPPLPDVRIVGIRQARDELLNVRPTSRPPNLPLPAPRLPTS